MSFSFTARGATVALALAAVAAEMAKVVEAQPIHKHDAAPEFTSANVGVNARFIDRE